MLLNNILSDKFNIGVDCFHLSDNITRTQVYGNTCITFLLNYSEEEEDNIKQLKKLGFELYIDEDFIKLLYSDNNRKLLKDILAIPQIDLIEISAINVQTENGYKLFINEIQINYIDIKLDRYYKEIKEIFDFEKVGISIEEITDKYMEFNVIHITRRIKDINKYKEFNIELYKNDREIEIINSDESRGNLLNFLQYYFKKNGYYFNLNIVKYYFRDSSIEIDKLCIDKFIIKYDLI